MGMARVRLRVSDDRVLVKGAVPAVTGPSGRENARILGCRKSDTVQKARGPTMQYVTWPGVLLGRRRPSSVGPTVRSLLVNACQNPPFSGKTAYISGRQNDSFLLMFSSFPPLFVSPISSTFRKPSL